MNSPIIPDLLRQAQGQRAYSDALPAPVIAPIGMNTPNLPNVQMPALPQAAPSQSVADLNERNRLISTGSGIDQIKNPILRGLARTADIAGSVFAPLHALEYAIPGTQEHHQLLMHQANANVVQDQANAKANTDQQDAQAQVVQRQALAAQETAKAAQLADPQKAVDPSKTVQTDDGVYQLNPATGKYDVRVGDRVEKPVAPETAAYNALIAGGSKPLEAFQQLNSAKNTKDASFQQQFLDAYQKAHPDVPTTDAIAATIRATSVQPKIDVHNAEARPEATGTWSPGFDANKNPVMFNSKTGEVRPMDGSFSKSNAATAKIGADEQKRADLAENMNGNINELEDILTRRPDLFGPLAGRMTQAKVAFGTDDKDAARLITLEHQLGMVAQGAHGMRSAQGVESAANSLVNGFKNSPSATKAALESARSSVATFQRDSQAPGQARSAASVPVTAPDGSVHNFPTQAAADTFKKLAGIK